MSGPDIDAFKRRLTAAEGFLELGLPQDAWDELEEIEPEHRDALEVLKLRLNILIPMQRWESAAILGDSIIRKSPTDGDFFCLTAYAVRRCRSLVEARDTLLLGRELLQNAPVFHFNMACYECQLGNLDTAKAYLATAFKLDPKWRVLALEEKDLEPLWKRA